MNKYKIKRRAIVRAIICLIIKFTVFINIDINIDMKSMINFDTVNTNIDL